MNMKRILAVLLALLTALSLNGTALAAGSNPFRDVSATDYFYEQVLEMSADGVVKGYGDGSFGP
ncbi:MAG: S-layer homology domain-containing protein [Bacillota bacterium]|nr:S-layer homology domain-containing protein [Bacillota bacterium]